MSGVEFHVSDATKKCLEHFVQYGRGPAKIVAPLLGTHIKYIFKIIHEYPSLLPFHVKDHMGRPSFQISYDDMVDLLKKGGLPSEAREICWTLKKSPAQQAAYEGRCKMYATLLERMRGSMPLKIKQTSVHPEAINRPVLDTNELLHTPTEADKRENSLWTDNIQDETVNTPSEAFEDQSNDSTY